VDVRAGSCQEARSRLVTGRKAGRAGAQRQKPGKGMRVSSLEPGPREHFQETARAIAALVSDRRRTLITSGAARQAHTARPKSCIYSQTPPS
jgi:hypothetical protein